MSEQTTILKENPEQETVQLVTFEVNQQLFGMAVSQVQEVIRLGTITDTPGSSAIIEGVIDLRGNIIPVIDLRKRFQMEPATSQEGRRVIIAEVTTYIFGFIVDKVYEVHTFDLEAFEPPPPGVSAPGSEYTVGVTHQGGKLLLFLDINKILDIEQLLEGTP